MSFQLKAEHRSVLAQRLAAGVSRKEIAAELHHHPRSIGREVERNSIAGIYEAVQAQRLNDERRRKGRKPCHKMAVPATETYVKERLRQRWSPDEIAGRSKLDFPQESRRQVSRQLVYSWLKGYDHRQPLLVLMRRYFRRWRRRAVPLHQSKHALKNRPEIVNQRGRAGDWEVDTLVGPGSAVLLSMVERRSGFLSLLRVDERRAEPVRQACTGRLTQFPPELRRSITLDNGPEFAQPERLEKSAGVTVYKTQPHAPWQRGCIENLNGLIRQYFRKGTRFSDLTPYEIKQVEQALNDRPRKRLGYRTPSEVFHEQCQQAFQT